jgi:hypothetical protein
MNQLVLWAVALAGGVASVALVVTAKTPGAQCGDGFFPVGHRCCAAVSGDGKTCGPSRACPPPLVLDGGECTAPDVVVHVPETRITIGPSDWEADGVVRAREIHVGAFGIDAFEITEGRIHPGREDAAQAAGGLTRAEVLAFCEAHSGRLPTEEEWVAAAATEKATRYPWGDTGAVCRRAAWGLTDGPCAHGARTGHGGGSRRRRHRARRPRSRGKRSGMGPHGFERRRSWRLVRHPARRRAPGLVAEGGLSRNARSHDRRPLRL